MSASNTENIHAEKFVQVQFLVRILKDRCIRKGEMIKVMNLIVTLGLIINRKEICQSVKRENVVKGNYMFTS